MKMTGLMSFQGSQYMDGPKTKRNTVPAEDNKTARGTAPGEPLSPVTIRNLTQSVAESTE